jgi:hypothetical protein
MHFCKAYISIGGDREQVYYADQYAPISWPEVQVLQFIHGEDAIDRVQPFVRIDGWSSRDERQRLADKYSEDKVAAVFPRSGPGEMEAPQATLAVGTEWKNPITQEAELVEPPADRGPGGKFVKKE